MLRPMSFAPALLVAVTLGGCMAQPAPTAASRASGAAAAACKSSTETLFNRQNRYLLSERSTTDAPFSSSGVSGITTRGLSERYNYDTQLSNCLAGSGANVAAPTTQPPPPSGTPVSPY